MVLQDINVSLNLFWGKTTIYFCLQYNYSMSKFDEQKKNRFSKEMTHRLYHNLLILKQVISSVSAVICCCIFYPRELLKQAKSEEHKIITILVLSII